MHSLYTTKQFWQFLAIYLTEVTFLFTVSGRDAISKRDTFDATHVDRSIHLQIIKCYYVDCVVPDAEDVVQEEASSMRPDTAVFWSDTATWDGTEAGFGGNNGDGTYGPPADNTNVKILEGIKINLLYKKLIFFVHVYI